MHAVIPGTECVSSSADGQIAIGMQTVIAGIYRKGSVFYQQIATGLDSLGAGIFNTGVFGIAILCFTSGSCIFGSCASSSFTVSLCTAFFRSGLFHTGSLTGFLRTAVRSTVLHIAAFLICCSRILRWLHIRHSRTALTEISARSLHIVLFRRFRVAAPGCDLVSSAIDLQHTGSRDTVSICLQYVCSICQIDKSFALILAVFTVDRIFSGFDCKSSICDADTVLSGHSLFFGSNLIRSTGDHKIILRHDSMPRRCYCHTAASIECQIFFGKDCPVHVAVGIVRK